MSSHEYKSALRKLEPQIAARDCLLKVESLIFNTARGKQELMMSLISEFIFSEHAKHPISSLQEFQLVLVLSDYFSKTSLMEQTRNAVFMLLFGGTNSHVRINILIKMTSTAISAQLSYVLNCVGTLIQQVGFLSTSSVELAQSLVQDFVIFSSKSAQQLNDLPKIAPRFASNFMTAVTSLYLNEANQKVPLQEPPDQLLELFTNWITENPSLCLAAQQPLVLPSGMLSMPVDTPLAGLIRWSCIAALISNKEIYSKLHLSLLQSLLQAKPISGPPLALNAQHLLVIVNIIQFRLEEVGPNSEKNEAIQNCLERFAQCIQCALASQCVYGNIPQLLIRLDTLKPTNQLMQIIVNTNKQT